MNEAITYTETQFCHYSKTFPWFEMDLKSVFVVMFSGFIGLISCAPLMTDKVAGLDLTQQFWPAPCLIHEFRKESNGSCQACRQCGDDEEILEDCTPSADTVCVCKR